MCMPEPAARRHLREAREKAAAERQEDLLLWRMSIYGGGVASLVGMLAAAYLPFGHPLVTWLAVTFVLCAIFGLAAGAYVIRRGDAPETNDGDDHPTSTDLEES